MTYEKFKEYMSMNAFELALLELGEDVYGSKKEVSVLQGKAPKTECVQPVQKKAQGRKLA